LPQLSQGKRQKVGPSQQHNVENSQFMFLSEALATSVVKIAGRDVLASWKVLIALGVTPVLYTFYAILATLIVIRAQLPMQWRIATPFLTITNLPFMNYAALKFGEAGMDVLKWVDTECLISAY